METEVGDVIPVITEKYEFDYRNISIIEPSTTNVRFSIETLTGEIKLIVIARKVFKNR